MPCLRHRSSTFAPASASFRTAMICSSVNRFFFTSASPLVADSTSDPYYFRGARHVDQGFIDEAHGALSANGLSLDARPFALEEREKILVDLILVCRAHPVGRALVDL